MSSAEEPTKVEAEVKPETEVKTEDAQPEATKTEEPAVATEAAEAPVKVEETKSDDTKTEEPKTAESTTEKADPAILKTTARINNDYRQNKKFDPRQLPESEDPLEMRAQTEFYFNNANLPTDEHMWNLTGGPENKPVELKHLHTFGRMRRFPNYTALVAALKDSDALEISGEEGSEVVKRKVPYEMRANKGDILKASVYVKGFGDEDAMTQFNLERFFKQFGGVNAVRLRRTEENLFKGSVFVEFASEEEAKSFLALDPTPKWEGHDLKIMSKQAYVEDKSRAIKAGEIQPSNSREKKFFEGRGGKGDKNRSGGRGGFRGDKNDWKNRRDHDQKSGFRDNRGGRGRGRGRGGRGGRGGRDRNDRDDRSNRRDEKPVDPRDAAQPMIKTTDDSGKPVDAANGNGKRAREDDGNAGEPQAKKVDAKAE